MGNTPIHEIWAASQWLPGMEPQAFSRANFASLAVAKPEQRPSHHSHIQARVRGRDLLEVVHLSQAGSVWPDFDRKALAPPAVEEDRLQANLKAIELLMELMRSQQQPTHAQRQTLMSYRGWGGFARLFEPLFACGLSAAQARLKDMLSIDEYDGIRAGVRNSIFISPAIGRGMWQLASNLGFRGGSVLEPAARTGLLLAAAPRSMARECVFTAVENDPIAGAILATVFDGSPVEVLQGEIDEVKIEPGSFDMVMAALSSHQHGFGVNEASSVGHVPGRCNYVVRAIQSVRPGGLIILCMPSAVLDSSSVRRRKWLAERVELIGAIRLPANAFKRQSNIELSADLVVMRKRATRAVAIAEDWIDLGQAADFKMSPAAPKWCYSKAHRKQVELDRPINKWFEQHPELIIGDLDVQETCKGKRLIANFRGDTAEFNRRLSECIQAITEAHSMRS